MEALLLECQVAAKDFAAALAARLPFLYQEKVDTYYYDISVLYIYTQLNGAKLRFT